MAKPRNHTVIGPLGCKGCSQVTDTAAFEIADDRIRSGGEDGATKILKMITLNTKIQGSFGFKI